MSLTCQVRAHPFPEERIKNLIPGEGGGRQEVSCQFRGRSMKYLEKKYVTKLEIEKGRRKVLWGVLCV